MNSYRFDALPPKVDVTGTFDSSCELLLSDVALAALENNRLKLKILHIGEKPKLFRFKLSLKCKSGNIHIMLASDDANIDFGDQSAGTYHLRLWRNSSIVIGPRTTANQVVIVCNNSAFVCGEDCMFSDGILIQSADQHGIVDIAAGKIVNDTFRTIRLGNHVWLGRDCSLMPNAAVGNGAIIGAGSIVTKPIPAQSLAVGIPARVIKKNYTWTRPPTELDGYAQRAIAAWQAQHG